MSLPNTPIITLDVDWASDAVIEYVAELLVASSVRATWFATHQSLAVKGISRNELFEIGIHPNCLEGSSHGEDDNDVLANLKTMFPEATSMRTHGLYQSSPFLYQANTRYGIQVDVSLFLKCQPHLKPFRYKYDEQNIMRIPYFWGDDAEMYEDNPAWNLNHSKHQVEGVKIYDFHPVHVALNTTRMEDYEAAKSVKPINQWDRDFILQRQQPGNGPLSLFEQMVDVLAGGGTTIQELAAAYEEHA